MTKELKKRLGSRTMLKRLTKQLDWYIATSPSIRGLAPAQAFELCHALLDIASIQAIEPELEIASSDMPDAAGDEFILLRDGFVVASAIDPATDNQCAWHIEQVRAKEARDHFAVQGNGIRVAHLDTGYTVHPELVTGTAIRPDLGYNFQEKQASPIQPIKGLGSGHGTATASILVSVPGKQHSIPNVSAYVEGVAPAVELVPMRVDKNVWWIGAAHDVAGIGRAIDTSCSVISMSRSGLDYAALRDAVALAGKHGIIVIAAAGNCNLGCGIRSPARYPSVVCVAGSVFAGRPWKDSSHGPEVTIAAPAHSVYRARAFKRDNDYAYTVERSSGTSYATPIVAGAAALWLERHGGHENVSTKVGGKDRVPMVFKHLVSTAGVQDGVEWNKTKYGPGILDCVKLLSASLPFSGDINKVELAAHTPRASMVADVRRQMISNIAPAALDGRALSLLSLELEAAELQEPIARTLAAGGQYFTVSGIEGFRSDSRHLRLSRPLRSLLGVRA